MAFGDDGLHGLGLDGQVLAEALGQFAGADGVGVAALGDFAGHVGGFQQDLFQRLDLFEGQGARLGLEAFDALGCGLWRTHQVIDLGLGRRDDPQVGTVVGFWTVRFRHDAPFDTIMPQFLRRSLTHLREARSFALLWRPSLRPGRSRAVRPAADARRARAPHRACAERRPPDDRRARRTPFADAAARRGGRRSRRQGRRRGRGARGGDGSWAPWLDVWSIALAGDLRPRLRRLAFACRLARSHPGSRAEARRDLSAGLQRP